MGWRTSVSDPNEQLSLQKALREGLRISRGLSNRIRGGHWKIETLRPWACTSSRNACLKAMASVAEEAGRNWPDGVLLVENASNQPSDPILIKQTNLLVIGEEVYTLTSLSAGGEELYRALAFGSNLFGFNIFILPLRTKAPADILELVASVVYVAHWTEDGMAWITAQLMP